MRKILTIISMVSLLSFPVKAADFDFGSVSVTGGFALNSAVYGGSAKETNRDESNVIRTVNKESAVFTDEHQSFFGEVNVGEFVSLGFEHTPDSISTPENKRTTQADGNSTAGTTSVSVDFNDLNVAYLKFNLPGGMYLKYGYVDVNLDIKESMASGSTYANVGTEGTLAGIGYSRPLGDAGLALRVEGSYMSLDDVTTSNGVSTSGATVANGGRNQIDASNLEGLNGKIALTYTFGG